MRPEREKRVKEDYQLSAEAMKELVDEYKQIMAESGLNSDRPSGSS